MQDLGEGLELAVPTNSPVGFQLDNNGNNTGTFFRTLVTNVYLNDVKAVFVP